jgi:RNA polymerase sigma factor FliA
MTKAPARREVWHAFLNTPSEQSRAALIESYYPLVRTTVRRCLPFAHQSVDIEDLIAAGQVGLIKAIDQYDPSRGFQFATLAIQHIRGSIREWMRAADPLPRAMRERVRALEQAHVALASRERHSPTREAIAAELGWDVDEVTQVTKEYAMTFPQSLEDRVFGSTSDGMTLMEAIEDPDPSPHDQALAKDQKAAIRQALSLVPQRRREVLTLYYMENRSAREIARLLSISESRIYQIVREGVADMRRLLTGQEDLFLP